MQRCLGRYALEEPVASGAHGRVWRGVHLASGTPVAVKVLRGDPESHASFETEATAIARLDHPHILPILDLGRVDEPIVDRGSGQTVPVDAPLIVTPWADGGTLGTDPLPVRRVRALARQLLEALAHAHARGVLHLDLKPANILLNGGDVLLADFSVAALGTKQGLIQGTPHYMAPEQLRGGALSAATDRYALGCVLFHLLAGHPPFRAADTQDLARAHLTSVPPPLPAQVPLDLARWVQTLLAKSPWARFATDRAAADALRDAADTGGSVAIGGEPEATSQTLTMEGFALDFDVAPLGHPATPAPVGTMPPALEPPPLGDWRDFPVPVRGRLDSVASPSVQLLRLRTLPTVGRVAAQDALWEALGATTQRPSLIVVHGPPGAGASHLGRWIQTLAIELGVARAVQLDEAVPAGLRGVCWLDDPDRPVLNRVLAALGDPGRGAALYVVSTREPPRGPIASLGQSIELGPMSPEDHAVLVSQVVGLQPTSLVALYRASSGLPGPTVERLGQALRSGALAPEGDRWTLDLQRLPTEEVPERIRADPTMRIALQVASAFDGVVPLDVWRAGCRAVGLTQPDRVLHHLEPLLRRVGDEVHVRPGVRDAVDLPGALLERLARADLGSRAERGSWLIRAGDPIGGASLLLEEVEHRIRGRAATLHPWLSAAERALEGAVEPAHPLAARLRYHQGRRQAVYRHAQAAQQLLDALEALDPQPRGMVGALRAHVLRCRGEAAASIQAAQDTFQACPDLEGIVAVHLHHAGGYAAGALHDADRVEHHFRAGAGLAARSAYPQWEVGMLTDGAGWLGRLGDPRAEGMSREALERAEALQELELAAFARVNLGEAAWERGQREVAAALFAEAERDLAAQGSIVTLSCRLLRLCVALEQGDAVRTRLTALRRVFEGFPSASFDLVRCRTAEAVASWRDGESARGLRCAEEVAAILEAQPELRLPVLMTLLGELADQLAAGHPGLSRRLRPGPET